MSKDPHPWPRLTETLTGPRTPAACQGCGAGCDLTIWREHNDRDRPEDVFLSLCDRCGKALIEKHPRLYAHLPANVPLPGVMTDCLGCRWHTGMDCDSPLLTKNGGPALIIRFAQPFMAHVDGTRGGRRCGWTETIYPSRPRCEGREEGEPPYEPGAMLEETSQTQDDNG